MHIFFYFFFFFNKSGICTKIVTYNLRRHRCSSDLIPGQGTSICCSYSHKTTKKKMLEFPLWHSGNEPDW